MKKNNVWYSFMNYWPHLVLIPSENIVIQSICSTLSLVSVLDFTHILSSSSLAFFFSSALFSPVQLPQMNSLFYQRFICLVSQMLYEQCPIVSATTVLTLSVWLYNRPVPARIEFSQCLGWGCFFSVSVCVRVCVCVCAQLFSGQDNALSFEFQLQLGQ